MATKKTPEEIEAMRLEVEAADAQAAADARAERRAILQPVIDAGLGSFDPIPMAQAMRDYAQTLGQMDPVLLNACLSAAQIIETVNGRVASLWAQAQEPEAEPEA